MLRHLLLIIVVVQQNISSIPSVHGGNFKEADVRLTAFMTVLCAVTPVFTQDAPYVRGGSIGSAPKAPPSIPGEYRSLVGEELLGQRVVFLPKPVSLREYGYETNPQAAYTALVGRVATVKSFAPPDSYGFSDVTLTLADGSEFRVSSHDGVLSEVAPVADLEYARSRWLGKKLWLKPRFGRAELLAYNEERDDYATVRLPKNLLPLEVADIVAAFEEHAPVRIILHSPTGPEGYVDVSFLQGAGTDLASLLSSSRHFDVRFFETDPRKKFSWPAATWKAIEDFQVTRGMTKDQVRLSWGEPSKINRTTRSSATTEQWVYAHRGYLYFRNGVLDAIQN